MLHIAYNGLFLLNSKVSLITRGWTIRHNSLFIPSHIKHLITFGNHVIPFRYILVVINKGIVTLEMVITTNNNDLIKSKVN